MNLKLIGNKILYVPILLGLFFLLLSSYNKVLAVTIQYPAYDVRVDINEDTTFIVTENITSEFFGNAHGLRRDIPLYDASRDLMCQQGYTCGGFDRLVYLGVFDENNRKVDDAKYYEYEDELGNRFARFEWELWPQGKTVSGEVVKWSVKYKVIGGIRMVGDNYYFYWNMLPSNLGSVPIFTADINFPESVKLSKSNFQFYDDYLGFSSDEISIVGNSLVISKPDFYTLSNYTISYQFKSGELLTPGMLEYVITSPQLGNEVYLDGDKISDKSEDKIAYFPAGVHTLEFTRAGYVTDTQNVTVAPGQSVKLSATLQPTPFMSVLLVLNWLVFIAGIILIPIGIILIYRFYQKRGRDRKMPKTIIPLFSPPKGVSPYLLGSLKDEKVDRVDIVGSVIDLAYRGYIKVKEIEKDKNYELTRLAGKPNDVGLNDTEKDIMEAIFNGVDVVETKDLKNHFPLKYIKLEEKIYKEMITSNYFEKSPQSVRQNFAGIGILLLMTGIFAVIFGSIIVSLVTGFVTILTPAIALVLVGIAVLIASPYMPAKTEHGSKVYADILGFRMYLHTAERFRLQNLGPEEFERYLSFAIVFGIEEEWAEKFDGIYKGAPEWYEGTGNLYDAIWISNFTRGFADSTVTNFFPVTSGSSMGGGWSSGGSFGGFSGGGGGGGSVGGW